MDRSAVDEKSRTVSLSFSSETPVERFFGMEILDHQPGSVMLERINGRGALLVEHNTRDQVGVVERASVENVKGQAIVRFGKSARAQEVFQDVLDGVRQNVSVSYRVHKARLVETNTEGQDVFRVMLWQPLELSFVAVPADHTVGVGRSADTGDETQIEIEIPQDMQRNIHLDAKPVEGGGGAGTGTVTVDPQKELTNMRSAEKKRIDEIRAIGVTHRCQDLADTAITDGTGVDDFRKQVLETRYNAKPIETADPNIGLSPKEIKRYSLVRAINCMATNRELDGFEKECSDGVAKLVRKEPNGFFIPHDVASRSLAEVNGLSNWQVASLMVGIRQMQEMQRALSVSPGSAGGFTIGTDVLGGSLIELLRNKTLVVALGARTLAGLVGNVAIPRVTGGATAYWLADNADLTPSDQAFGQLGLVPHRLAAATAYSKQLLAQSSIDVEGFVRDDLMRVLAVEKDRAAINGSGAAGEPLGILNTSGIGAVTFGAAPTWQKVIDFETAVANANADLGNLAYLVTPAVRGKWKATVKVSNTANFLWGGSTDNNLVNGYRAEATKNVPSDRVIFGNWSDLVVADWTGWDVIVDPYSKSLQGQVQVVIQLLTDDGLRHAGSFCASSDSGAQ